jgi:Electron transfer DM13
MQGKLLILGLAAMAIVGCAKEVATQPTENPISQGVQSVQATETASPATVVKSGSFVKAEHETTGTARIITENGQNFLELDQNFKTDNGPDLFVILHRKDKLPITGLKEKDYVTLSPLQKISGSQRYAIPESVKIADFASAAIWCRRFNATFGYAAFSK